MLHKFFLSRIITQYEQDMKNWLKCFHKFLEKKQRRKIKVYIEKLILEKLNELTEEKFAGLFFKSAEE